METQAVYESAACTDLDGPKFCKACQTCAKGQYASTACTNGHDRLCSNCTRECPDGLMHTGIMGECGTGPDAVDVVSCVQATPTSIFAAGRQCAANEWYVGTRTAVFAGATVRDTGDDTYAIQQFKSDFFVLSMDKIVFLSVVGATSESR